MPSARSILLVEEDAVCRGFLADNLIADGYQVLIAVDKTDAIAQLAHAPDLVLCDVNGATLELLDAVRGAAGLAARIDPSAPLIVLTRLDAGVVRIARQRAREGAGTMHRRLPAASQGRHATG